MTRREQELKKIEKYVKKKLGLMALDFLRIEIMRDYYNFNKNTFPKFFLEEIAYISEILEFEEKKLTIIENRFKDKKPINKEETRIMSGMVENLEMLDNSRNFKENQLQVALRNFKRGINYNPAPDEHTISIIEDLKDQGIVLALKKGS